MVWQILILYQLNEDFFLYIRYNYNAIYLQA